MRMAVKLKKEAFWAWMAAADKYWDARRAAASPVAEAKTCERSSGRLWRRTFGQLKGNSGRPTEGSGRESRAYDRENC